MTHQVYAFEPPERFVAGTVGEPGERTFFLQARGGGRLVSVALEKVQVSLLAEKLEELLAEAQRRFGVRRCPRPSPVDRRQRAAGHPGRRGVPGRHAGPGLGRATPRPWSSRRSPGRGGDEVERRRRGATSDDDEEEPAPTWTGCGSG